MSRENAPPWGDEDRARAAAMLRAGLSASKMAPHFGVTRNAIIGRVHRDKMLLAIGFKSSNGQPKGEPKPKLARVPTMTFPKAPKPAPAPVRIIPTFVVCREITLLDLKRGDCRWPCNDPRGGETFLFCGLTADPGHAYCPTHYLRSIGAGTISERRAGIDLQKAAA